jgi:hypothetical protein
MLNPHLVAFEPHSGSLKMIFFTPEIHGQLENLLGELLWMATFFLKIPIKSRKLRRKLAMGYMCKKCAFFWLFYSYCKKK